MVTVKGYNFKGQSISEYAVLIGLITLALVGMQVYMKRGIQGVVKVAADQLGPQQGQQVLIAGRRQTNTVSNTIGSRSGGVGTQVFTGGRQERSTNTISTSSGTSNSISTQ